MQDIQDTSPKGELNKTDWKKIGIGAGVAVAGAVITAFSEYLLTVDFGVWTPFVASGLSIVVNIGRKALAGKNQY